MEVATSGDAWVITGVVAVSVLVSLLRFVVRTPDFYFTHGLLLTFAGCSLVYRNQTILQALRILGSM